MYSVHISGQGIKIDARASLHGDPPSTLWWLMVGATAAVCMLVVFLVLLAIYYAYTQRYLCSDIGHCTVNRTNGSVTSATSVATSDTSVRVTPEHIKLTSQNSSQQELMTSSEGEGDFVETRRLRHHLHQVIV